MDHAEFHRHERTPGPVDAGAVAGSNTRYGVSGFRWGFAVDEMPAQADGSAVSAVPDLAGNYNLSQANGVNQPLYRTNQINSLPALQFDGGDFLEAAVAAVSTLIEAEGFVIVKINIDPPTNGAQAGLWTIGGSGNMEHYPWTDGTIYETFGTSARKTTVNPTPSLTSWRCYQVASSASAWTSWLDGSQLFTTATNTVGWPTLPGNPIYVGRSAEAGGGTSYLAGYIAELIIYDHVLSSGDRTTVKAALASKYNLTIA